MNNNINMNDDNYLIQNHSLFESIQNKMNWKYLNHKKHILLLIIGVTLNNNNEKE